MLILRYLYTLHFQEWTKNLKESLHVEWQSQWHRTSDGLFSGSADLTVTWCEDSWSNYGYNALSFCRSHLSCQSSESPDYRIFHLVQARKRARIVSTRGCVPSISEASSNLQTRKNKTDKNITQGSKWWRGFYFECFKREYFPFPTIIMTLRLTINTWFRNHETVYRNLTNCAKCSIMRTAKKAPWLLQAPQLSPHSSLML